MNTTLHPLLGVVMMSWSSTERILGGGLLLSAQALFEAERIPLKFHDMAKVGHAAQEGRGEPWTSSIRQTWLKM